MHFRLLIVLIALSCHLAINDALSIKNKKWKDSTQTCPDPYESCNLGKDGMINVHIVPHTHDDVGLVTFSPSKSLNENHVELNFLILDG